LFFELFIKMCLKNTILLILLLKLYILIWIYFMTKSIVSSSSIYLIIKYSKRLIYFIEFQEVEHFHRLLKLPSLIFISLQFRNVQKQSPVSGAQSFVSSNYIYFCIFCCWYYYYYKKTAVNFSVAIRSTLKYKIQN